MPLLDLADGRRVRYETYGSDDGRVIFSLHGTPGSRLGYQPSDAAVERLNLCIVSYDRPGYGDSDPDAGRKVADGARDVAAIADALGVEQFAVYGISGGAPYALACAAMLGHRVRRAAALVCPAPPDQTGLDWTEGMDPENAKVLASDWDAARAELAVERDLLLADPEAVLTKLEARLPAPDVEVLADPAFRRHVIAERLEALRPGVLGWADDGIALSKPWGFDPAEIRVPVYIWCGAEDVLAPPAHARWLAERIPHRTFVEAPGKAHLGAIAMQDTVVDWLTAD